MSDDVESAAEGLHGQKRLWEKWIEDPCTKSLMELLQGQVDTMQTTLVMQPLETSDGVYRQEYMKGQIEGRLSIANLVATTIENLTYEINERKKESQDENKA